MVNDGDSISVINRFYDNDIVQIENNEPPVTGKNKLLELEKASIEKVYSFDLTITSMVIDEPQQKVMGEMFEGLTVKLAAKRNFTKHLCSTGKRIK